MVKNSDCARVLAASIVLLFFVLILVATSHAQSCAVSGSVVDLAGASCGTNCEVRAKLYNCADNLPKSGGKLVLGAMQKTIPVDANTGAFSGTMYANDEISCGGIANTTDYTLGVYINGVRVGPEQRYHLTAAQCPFNPANQQAVNDDPPSSENDYAIRNGDNTFQGTQDFTNATVVGLDVAVGSGAPLNGPYVTTQADASLMNETPWSQMFQLGALASRPASDATKVGRLYCTNDSGSMRCTRDNGASWDDLLYSWNEIEGKPATFAPSAHAASHAAAGSDPITISESQVTNLTSDLAGKQASLGFTPLNPANNLSDVANPATARGNLGAAATSHTHVESDVTSLVTDLAAKEATANKNQANGYAGLDAGSKLAASQLPAPTAATLGGVESKTCSGTDKLSAIGTDGIPVCTADQTGAAGGGITSLNGSTQATQTFVNGTNIAVSTNAGTGAHTIGISGTIGLGNGGTNYASNTGAAGKVLIGDGSGHFVEGDPLVQGLTAHDASGASTNPVAIGGFASAAAPTDVSADGDIVRAWMLRSGAQAVQLTHNGSLYKPTTPSDTQPISAASLPLPAGAATAAKQPALGTAGSASADVISVQGVAGMTAVKVDGSAVTQPVSGTVTTSPPSNASTNVTQLGGTAVDTNSGVKSAGTQRVVIATDQPALTNALKVDGSAVTQPVSGTVSVNALPTGSNVIGKVSIDQTTPGTTNGVRTDNSGATGSAVPARASYVGGSDGTNLVGIFVDPCQRGAKTYYPVNISTATTVRFAAPAASKKTYVCSIMLVAAAADNVNVIEGTGGTCGTSTAGVLGGTTAASGPNLPANGGFALGNGASTVFATAGTNVDMCLITSAAVQLSGHITFVQY